MKIMSRKRCSVTIGIPAHNEEKNIGRLLDAILSQTGSNFTIEKIIVACDGCTDHTADIVYRYSLKNPSVTLINDGKRLGQSQRLNEFYRMLKSDIFVTFDGDVVLGHQHVIAELVGQFTSQRVGLVGGYTIPYKQKTFIGKALEAHEFYWRNVVWNINNGENISAHVGPISAVSKHFIKTVQIPPNIISNDHFLYLQCIKNGFEFRLSEKSFVYFRIPTTFNDYMRQQARFEHSTEEIKAYFGDMAEKNYRIPRIAKILSYLVAFINYPVYFPVALVLEVIRKVFGYKFKEKGTSGIWLPISSTK